MTDITNEVFDTWATEMLKKKKTSECNNKGELALSSTHPRAFKIICDTETNVGKTGKLRWRRYKDDEEKKGEIVNVKIPIVYDPSKIEKKTEQRKIEKKQRKTKRRRLKSKADQENDNILQKKKKMTEDEFLNKFGQRVETVETASPEEPRYPRRNRKSRRIYEP